jgi:uncharacterized membrane protein
MGFDNPEDADNVLSELGRLQSDYLIDLEDAVVTVRQSDGRLNVKQSVDLVRVGVSAGGASGAMLGTLVGMLFLNPIAGFAVGGLVGAGGGALSGSAVDYGIKEDFIRAVAETLRPNTSALFILIRKVKPEEVLSKLSRFRGRVIRSSLSTEQEARLQTALSARLCQNDSQPGEAGTCGENHS